MQVWTWKYWVAFGNFRRKSRQERLQAHHKNHQLNISSPQSRLSDFRSSTLLAIADIEDNDSEDRLLPRDEIKTLLANLQPTSEPVPRDQIDKLLEQAKIELDL